MELLIIQMKVGTLPSSDCTSDVRLSRFVLFLLQLDRLQLTAVYYNRRVCKDNTSQDRFRSVKSYKEFAYKSEIE